MLALVPVMVLRYKSQLFADGVEEGAQDSCEELFFQPRKQKKKSLFSSGWEGILGYL